MTLTLFIPLLAFIATFAFALRSLGLGLVSVFAVGYVNGVVRANYMGVATTFMFDASLLGLYCGFVAGWPRQAAAVIRSRAGLWASALIAWPILLTLIPINDYLIQLVALRATVWFLPVFLIATRLRATDLALIARGLAVLNLMALAGGFYVYEYGVESLYPQNAVTRIIYMSKDVGGFDYYRIPSTFLSAHAYGGAMLLSLPFLLDRAFGNRVRWFDRSLAALGVMAAIIGILMCAARSPAIVFGVMMVIAWFVARLHPGLGVVAVGLMLAGIGIAATSERLQRATTLEDTEFVTDRVRASANESFFELMRDYPAGAGMGSSAGTSIPYFLADRAPVAIGLENEYSRILVDQGVVGLLLWLAFLIWLLHRPPPLRLDVPWGIGVVFMFSLVLSNWLTAFIGTGALSAVPGSALLLTQMGVLARVREVAVENRV